MNYVWLEDKLSEQSTHSNNENAQAVFFVNTKPFAYLDKPNKVVTLKCISVMIPVLACQFETAMKASAHEGFVDVHLDQDVTEQLLEDLIDQAVDLARL